MAASNGRSRNTTSVKFCYHCGRVTVGEPLFCNFCGRSYDVKLCPKLHANPRGTRVCSKCGSTELSIPQPRVPFWAKILLVLLALIPGLILVVFFFDRFLFRHDMLLGLAAVDFVLVVLWWGWTQIPVYFRKTIHRWLRRNRESSQNP